MHHEESKNWIFLNKSFLFVFYFLSLHALNMQVAKTRNTSIWSHRTCSVLKMLSHHLLSYWKKKCNKSKQNISLVFCGWMKVFGLKKHKNGRIVILGWIIPQKLKLEILLVELVKKPGGKTCTPASKTQHMLVVFSAGKYIPLSLFSLSFWFSVWFMVELKPWTISNHILCWVRQLWAIFSIILGLWNKTNGESKNKIDS